MSIKIGINGFGRMGRLALRYGWGRKNIEFVQVNEISCDVACSAHLLKYDSIHGKWEEAVSITKKSLLVNGERVRYSSVESIEQTDWSGCDIVIEASGQFRDVKKLQAYLDQGVKKVVVSAPVSGALNLVMGVNDHLYEHQQHAIVTAASCTTNCLAPVVKVMQETLGIVHGTMTTIHDMTNTQRLIDSGHKDLRRARASSLSLIPTSTGSARAITEIFPELQGKLNGLAIRVPLLNASLTDFVFESKIRTSEKEVNEILRTAALNDLSGILGFECLPLVSVDYTNDTRSAIIDGPSTMVIDGTQVKLLAWYDNEVAYVCRMLELTRMLAQKIKKAGAHGR